MSAFVPLALAAIIVALLALAIVHARLETVDLLRQEDDL